MSGCKLQFTSLITIDLTFHQHAPDLGPRNYTGVIFLNEFVGKHPKYR